MKYFLLLFSVLLISSCSEENSEDQIINTRFMYAVKWNGDYRNLTLISPTSSPVRLLDNNASSIIEVNEDRTITLRNLPCENGVLSGNLVSCPNYFYNLDKNKEIFPENFSTTVAGTMDAGGRILYSWDWKAGVLTLNDTRLSPEATDDNSLVMWSEGGNSARIISGNGKTLISEQVFEGKIKNIAHNGETIYFLYENESVEKFLRACSSKENICEEVALPITGTVRNFAVNEAGICVFKIGDSSDLSIFDFDSEILSNFKPEINPDSVFFQWEEGKFLLVEKSSARAMFFSPEI